MPTLTDIVGWLLEGALLVTILFKWPFERRELTADAINTEINTYRSVFEQLQKRDSDYLEMRHKYGELEIELANVRLSHEAELARMRQELLQERAAREALARDLEQERSSHRADQEAALVVKQERDDLIATVSRLSIKLTNLEAVVAGLRPVEIVQGDAHA